jgi:nickel transport protein
MPGRYAVVSLLVGLCLAGNAHAHRLEGEYRILPGGKVRIESWYDITGDSPVGAEVKVFRADGQVLAEGKIDEQGLFVFSFSQAEPLKVVISAGGGHRKELMIPAEELTTSPASVPLADRRARVELKDVLAGVALLLAVAALAMSWRNARELRRLKKRDH